jgi:hypothetical protein
LLEFLKTLASVQPGSQMFVLAVISMALIVGFGWVFVKVLGKQTDVLNKQADILGDIKEVITKQVELGLQQITHNTKVEDMLITLVGEMALHRQATEGALNHISGRPNGS